nr:hypothetical protein [Clostridiales bacterium]
MRKSKRTLAVVIPAVVLAVTVIAASLSLPGVFSFSKTDLAEPADAGGEDPSSICEDSEDSDYEIAGLKTITADFSG